jgi:hypothetical protein
MVIRDLFAAFAILTVPAVTLAQSASPAAQPTPSQAGVSTPTTPAGSVGSADCRDPAYAKSSLEYCKYLLEEEKLNEQRTSSWTTAVALFLSALVGFGTIIFNIRNATAQARLQAKLKALEVVVSATGPNSARQRLAIVDGILGSDLVPEATNPQYEIEGIGTGHDEGRRDLLKSLADHPERRADIISDWEVVFGNSKLGPNIRALRDPSHVPQARSIVSQPTPNTPLQPTAEKRGG